MQTPVVIYAAKSTQDRHLSIPDQLADCRAMAETEGWTVVAEYRDEGFSAYSGNRGPGLARARTRAAEAAAEVGGVAILVAQHSDRFARGAGDKPGAAEALGEIWHSLRRQNVHLRTVEDDPDMRDQQSVAAVGHRAMMDSRRKSASVRKGMRRRRMGDAERGVLPLHAGGDVYGYLRDPDVGLRPHPDQAPVVARIFRMVAEGTPQAEVVRTLNAEVAAKGAPLPLGGGRWQQGSLSNMLTRRTYLGETPADDWRERKNRNRPEKWQAAAHEGIVDADLFKATATANAARAKLPARGGGRQPKAGHLLTGRLLHHVCGAAMVPRTGSVRKDGSVRGWYECGGRKSGLCDGFNVPMSDVDAAVLGYLAEVGVDAAASVAAAQSATAQTVETVLRELDAARADAATAAANAARVRADYMAGAITAADWTDLRSTFTADADRAGAQLERLENLAAAKPEETIPLVVDALTVVRAAVAEKNFDGIRKVLRALFEHFEIGESGEPPNIIPEGSAAEVVAAKAAVRARLRRAEAAAGRTIAETNAEAYAEEALDDHGEAQPVEPTPGLILLPVPRRDALQSVMNGDEEVFLVDENGRDVFRRLPVPTFNVNGLAITSSPPRSK